MTNQNRSNPPIAVASGISKREHFAALFLAGMCANPEVADLSSENWMDELVATAIRQADLLIEKLGDSPKSSDPEDLAMDELRAEEKFHQEYYRPLYSTEFVKRT